MRGRPTCIDEVRAVMLVMAEHARSRWTGRLLDTYTREGMIPV